MLLRASVLLEGNQAVVSQLGHVFGHAEQEIVEALSDAIEQIEDYREQFDADDPDDVSLVEASRDMATEDAWEALSEWETLERQAALLDAARRDHPATDSTHGHIDA